MLSSVRRCSGSGFVFLVFVGGCLGFLEGRVVVRWFFGSGDFSGWIGFCRVVRVVGFS